MYTPILIVGTGIAGLTVAYNLKMQEINSVLLTKTENVYESNSVIAPANMRMFEDINRGIDLYMEQCNGNYEMIKEIYSNQSFLIELFNNLEIKYKKTPIGIIPDEVPVGTGGGYIIKNLLKNTGIIKTSSSLIDIKIHNRYISCLIFDEKNNEFCQINCSVIVFATGGFAGLFKTNDNLKVATGECTYLLQSKTGKLKGASTIMFHPFGVNEGKRILVGDVVSLLDKIYEKNQNGDLQELYMDNEILEAIKNNKYHSNHIFSQLVKSFNNKEIYLHYNDIDKIKEKLKENGYSINIIKDNFIRVWVTAHYTAGGIEVGKDFKVLDNIYVCGEIAFDGNKGIGRLPGHPFASAIISGKIIADQIIKSKDKYEKYDEIETFEITKLLEGNKTDNFESNKNKFDNLAEKVTEILCKEKQIEEIKILENELANFAEYLKSNMKCVQEVYLYYRTKLLMEVLKLEK